MEHDQSAEREIERWFGNQRQELRAPAGLWNDLEPMLGRQDHASSWKRIFATRFTVPKLNNHPVAVVSLVGVIALAVAFISMNSIGTFSADSSNETVYAGLPAAPATALPNVRSSSTQDSVPFPTTVAASATGTPSAGQARSLLGVPGLPGRPGSAGPAGAQGSSLSDLNSWLPTSIPTNLTREQAEELAQYVGPSGGYGLTQEQFDLRVEQLMRGDLSGLDPANLPLFLTTFQDYGFNPFVDAAVEPFSTFAMDVDTASYTIGRGYLQSGRTPPPSSVRVEEYINYFDQDYPAAQDTLSGHIEGALSPYADDGRFLMRVGVNAVDIDPSERKSANIVLVIDTSGSMGQDNRIRLVQQGVLELLRRLQPGDTVGIVTYSESASLQLRPTSDFRQAESIIFQLQPVGSTNVQAGLQLGFTLADQAFSSDKNNHVILLSDGVANVGETESSRLLDDIQEFARGGILLSTIGVGLGNFNDALLEQLADNGDGSYTYIDTDEEARKALGADITGLLEIVAKDAKIQLQFNPKAVESYRLVGYENRSLETEEFRDDSVDAGEVGAGHTVTAIYELRLMDDGDADLGSLRLRWLDPDTGEANESEKSFSRADIDRSFDSASPRFRFTASVMAYAELLRGSPWFAEVDILDVMSTLAGSTADLGDAVEERELLSLLNKAIELGLFSRD